MPPYVVDFENVSTVGLESSPVAEALAGLRANEARYWRNKYGHVFTVSPVSEAPEALERMTHILATERDLQIAARPLEATDFEAGGLHMTYVIYESGLVINVMYATEEGGKRAVGFKLSEGMEVPAELAAAGFKFARQRSKLARSLCHSGGAGRTEPVRRQALAHEQRESRGSGRDASDGHRRRGGSRMG